MTERLKTLLVILSLMIIWFIENNWVSIIQAIQWSWSQMTLLSALILIMIIAIGGLFWITLVDKKRWSSKRWHDGYKIGYEDRGKKSKK